MDLASACENCGMSTLIEEIFGMFVTTLLSHMYYESYTEIMGSKCTKGSSADKTDCDTYQRAAASSSAMEREKGQKANCKRRRLHDDGSGGEPGPSGSTNQKQQVSEGATSTASPSSLDCLSTAQVETRVAGGSDAASAAVASIPPSVPVNRNEHVMLGRNDVERSNIVVPPPNATAVPSVMRIAAQLDSGHHGHGTRAAGKRSQTSKQNRKLDFIDRLVLETLQLIRTLVEK